MLEFNRKLVLERLGGQEKMLARLAQMFYGELHNYLEPMAEALSRGDVTTLAREVHSVKSTLATFGDDEGAQWAQAFESQLRQQGLTPDAAPQVARLHHRLQELAQVLKQHFPEAT